MINLKDIVCDFEYAKKLKELGVKQESLFSCFIDDDLNKIYIKDSNYDGGMDFDRNLCSAFTSDELLNILPKTLPNYYFLIIHRIEEDDVPEDIDEYYVGQFGYRHDFYIDYKNCEDDSKICEEIHDKKLSNALAKMLVWLIENKYVKVEDL
jgi:hypothetical protein